MAPIVPIVTHAVFDSFAMSNRFCTPDHAKSMTKKQLVSFSDRAVHQNWR